VVARVKGGPQDDAQYPLRPGVAAPPA